MENKQPYDTQAKFRKLKQSSYITIPDVLGHFTAIVIAYYFFTHVINNEQVIYWAIFITTTFVSRMITYWLLRYYLNFSMKQWENALIFLSAISATAWGSLIFLVTNDPVQILTTTLLFLGCMGGALGAVGNNFSVYISFVTPISLLLIARLLALDSPLFYSVAFIITTYYIASSIISYRFTQTSYQEATLKLKNEQLMKQLKTEKKIAEKANADKSRFLASASHDLRQPLQAMNLFAQALNQEVKEHYQQSLLSKLRESMHAMSNLLNSLLDISKLDAGLVQVKQSGFLLFPLLYTLKKNFEAQNNKPIQLTIETEIKTQDETVNTALADNVVIQSDPVLFENILANIFSNALKYTEAGEITVGCKQLEEGTYTVCIQDTGIGIAESEQDKIFDAFYQIHNTERDRSKGIGLGLSIVKHLCNLLDHKLVMHSELTKGTTFEITAPAAQASTPLAQAISTPQHFNASVLVVDDDQAILEGMQAMLTPWGCTIHTAQSIDETRLFLRENHAIDLLLVDYRLQNDCTGLDVIQEVRKASNCPELPAIIISGDTEPQRLQNIEKQGFEFLYKPIKPAQLRALMNYLLR